MCEYCDNENNNKEISDYAESLVIGKHETKGWCIRQHVFGWTKWFNRYFPIKYCPICGRKL
jgi:hypothetical protein